MSAASIDQNPALNGGTPIGNSQISSLADPGSRQQDHQHPHRYQLPPGRPHDQRRYRQPDRRGQSPGHGEHRPRLQLELRPHRPAQHRRSSAASACPPPGGFPGGEDGYYVQRNVAYNSVSVRSSQRAQYIEDKWQVNDRWLLSLGLRNDQFTDYNPAGEAFITQTKPQWAPRLGFSWDVNGDSSVQGLWQRRSLLPWPAAQPGHRRRLRLHRHADLFHLHRHQSGRHAERTDPDLRCGVGEQLLRPAAGSEDGHRQGHQGRVPGRVHPRLHQAGRSQLAVRRQADPPRAAHRHRRLLRRRAWSPTRPKPKATTSARATAAT